MKAVNLLFMFILVFTGCWESYDQRAERIEGFYKKYRKDYRINSHFKWGFSRRSAGSEKCYLAVYDLGYGFYLCRNDGLYELTTDEPESYIVRYGQDSVDLIISKANQIIKIINEEDLFMLNSPDTNYINYYFNKNDILVYAKNPDSALAYYNRVYPKFTVHRKYDKNWIWINLNEKN